MKEILATADWIDGLTTTQNMDSSIKKNFMLPFDSFAYTQVRNVIADATANCFEFSSSTQPLSVNSLAVTRTEQRGYYSPHVDAPQLGEFSTTVFLDDPNSYGGGELCLSLNGEEKKFKLPAGWAITYKTGFTHRVSQVTQGERKVAVFWVQTAIRDDVVRENIRKLMLSLKLQNKLVFQDCYKDCAEAEKDPVFLVSSVINDLRRHFTGVSK